MTDFEFLMGFQAVLLGLAVAELLSRLADAVGARRTVRLGWLTPLLALMVFMIATQVWMNLWLARDRLTVDGGMMFVSALNSAGFYLAAALVFPRQLARRSALDDHYWANKRYVAALLLATTVVNEVAAFLSGVRGGPPTPAMVLAYALYFLPLGVLLFSRSGRIDIAAMGVLIVQYLALKLA